MTSSALLLLPQCIPSHRDLPRVILQKYALYFCYIHQKPQRNYASFIATFTDIFTSHHACNYHPTLNVMDNECSKAVRQHIEANKMNIQLGAASQSLHQCCRICNCNLQRKFYSSSCHHWHAMPSIKLGQIPTKSWTRLNSLTPIWVRVGTKNYPSKDVLRRNSIIFLVSATQPQPTINTTMVSFRRLQRRGF